MAIDIHRILKEFRAHEKAREKAERIINKLLSNCRSCVNSIHAKKFAYATRSLEKAARSLKDLQKVIENFEILKCWGQTTLSMQEYTEAYILYHIITSAKIPSPHEIGVSSLPYILGCADVIGELRREVVNAVKDGDLKLAERHFSFMEKLFSSLSQISFRDAIVPGFRHKMDVNRRLLEDTRALIAEEYSRLRLIESLKSFQRRCENW